MNEHDILNAVTERFIATGKDSTVKDLSALLAVSESRIRALFARNAGMIDGVQRREAHTTGRSLASFYGPTRQHLASLLR